MQSRFLAGLGGLIVALSPPVAAAPADASPDDISGYPLAAGMDTGDYGGLSPGAANFFGYWLYFKTPDGRSCGLAPNGGPVGCDAVALDAPPGANQIVATAWQPAHYQHSDSATFARAVAVLPAGRRLQTIGASCAVDDRGAVHCQTEGNHGFILSGEHAVLW